MKEKEREICVYVSSLSSIWPFPVLVVIWTGFARYSLIHEKLTKVSIKDDH